jgi:hypothetical protein
MPLTGKAETQSTHRNPTYEASASWTLIFRLKDSDET